MKAGCLVCRKEWGLLGASVTGACWGGAGVTFYRAVEVVDPDDPDKLYLFDLKDPMHCPCFNIGVDAEDSTIISWSDLHCLYCLADGTKWAEHGNYHDLEDLVSARCSVLVRIGDRR